MRRLIFSILFLLTALFARANETVGLNESQLRTLDLMLQFNMTDSGALLSSNNGVEWDYLKEYKDFIIIFSKEDKQLWERYDAAFDDRMERLAKSAENNYFHRELLSETYLHKGLLLLLFQNTWQGMFDFWKAYKLHNEVVDRKGKVAYTQKLDAVFSILGGQVPESYTDIAGWFGMNGNTYKGLVALKSYCEQNEGAVGLGREGLIYYSYSLLKFAPETMLQSESKWVLNHTPEGPVMIFLSGLLAMKSGNMNKFPDLSDYEQSDFYFRDYPMLHFLKGKYLICKLDDSGEAVMKRFLYSFQGNSFKAEAYQLLTWRTFISNRKQDYERWNSMAVSKGLDPLESLDKIGNDAMRELLKVRLYFDGGFYKESLALLEAQKDRIIRRPYNIVEWNYRMARLLQKRGDPSMALPFYESAAQLTNPDDTRYYGAFAAMYAAQIHETNGNNTMAYFFYNKAVNMPIVRYADVTKKNCTEGLSRVTK